MNASIVIPTYNSAETLEKCLQSIRKNKTEFEYEIIVCDAHSTDNTIKIANKYADKVLIGKEHIINRNIGIDAAKGDAILFTDSDCLVPENWIEKMYSTLINRHCAGIGGGNVAWLENPTKQELSISKAMRSPFISFKARNTANYKYEHEVTHNPPINSAYYKTVLEEIGGFIEERDYPEDTDLDARIIKKKYSLLYIPNLVVQHKHKSNYKAFAKQMYDFGRKRVLINRKYRFIAKIYHYAPIVFVLMMCSPLMFIPYMMAGINSLICHDRGVFTVTLLFYENYGLGELLEWLTNI